MAMLMTGGAHQDPAGDADVCWVALFCFLTRFLTQDERGSTRRMEGGRACSRAGLILHQRSWGSRVSRRGKRAREAARSWSGSSTALDLTDMRIASLSRVPAMAWAVGVAGSCVLMKARSTFLWSCGLL